MGNHHTSGNKQTGEHLTAAYREIGIKAVAAAVKSNRKHRDKDRSDATANVAGQTEKGGRSMDDQRKRFTDKTAKAARENFEQGASAAQHATRNAEQSYSSALTGMREFNLKLIEMAHANTEAAFELAHEIASAEAPSDLAAIWA